MHIGSILVVLVMSILIVAYITHPFQTDESERGPVSENDEDQPE